MEKSLLNRNYLNGASWLQYFFSLIAIPLALSSCSNFNFWKKNDENKIDMEGYSKLSREDYESQLNYYSEFIKTNNLKLLKLSPSTKEYLNSISEEILSKNEIFFKKIKSYQFEVFREARPLYFSFPNGRIFLSTGLLDRYLKHESVLVSIIAFEAIRAEKSIYPKKLVIPVGTLSLEKLFSQIRLNSDDKIEIHKWAYYTVQRAGFDSNYYLSWLQIQNRNSYDFALTLGDPSVISREEAYFKAFLFKQKIGDEIIYKKESSLGFYKLLKEIKIKSEVI
jgi:hypothetical protein